MKIARCTPSRGLVHSRTEQTADMARQWAEHKGHEWANYWTHDLPIPDCFNVITQRAHAWGADLIWILEEDIALEFPTLALHAMLSAIEDGADVAIVDYTVGSPVPGFGRGIARDGANRIGVRPRTNKGVLERRPPARGRRRHQAELDFSINTVRCRSL